MASLILGDRRLFIPGRAENREPSGIRLVNFSFFFLFRTRTRKNGIERILLDVGAKKTASTSSLNVVGSLVTCKVAVHAAPIASFMQTRKSLMKKDIREYYFILAPLFYAANEN